ncbi:high osmolarity signaling protein Sho1p [Trichomonascus vanleenenianus]|uniref:osmosensor SHO1 n=1 Tax=Trichomonascus vanleenenianus TaxID=2268995 RepID=UPI003ECABC87
MAYSYGMDNSYRGRRRTGFSVSYIVGDPFALSSISIALIGWIIAFGGSIAVDVETDFPSLTWWGIVFEILLIAGIIYVIGAQRLHAYQMALVGSLAVATIYTTNSTTHFIWTGTPSSGAVTAGHILLSIINILWMLYFGTTPDARPRAFVDSFSIHNHTPNSMYTSGVSRGDSHRRSNPFASRGSNGDDINMNYAPKETSSAGPQMYTSDQLGGHFENTAPSESRVDSYVGSSAANNDMQSATDVLPAPTEYPFKATAIYSYQASPDDANEISFEKGEVLEVSDITGRWWQARRENGEVGICPSNYVELISPH